MVFPRVAEATVREFGAAVDVPLILVVDTSRHRVIADLVAQIDTQVRVGRLVTRQIDRRNGLIVGDDVATGQSRVLVSGVNRYGMVGS